MKICRSAAETKPNLFQLSSNKQSAAGRQPLPATDQTLVNISQKEWDRAKLLQGVFLELSVEFGQNSIAGLHKAFHQALRARRSRIRYAFPTFRSYYYRWSKRPVLETLLRKWKPGMKSWRPAAVAAVEATAILRRISVAAAYRIVQPKESYRTIVRHLENLKEITYLVRAERRKAEIVKGAERILARIASKGAKHGNN